MDRIKPVSKEFKKAVPLASPPARMGIGQASFCYTRREKSKSEARNTSVRTLYSLAR